MTDSDTFLLYLVDDEPSVLASLAALLRAHGFATQGFPSGEAFLAGFDPGARACLILDIRMPGMGGLELQAELIRRAVSLPVIMLTAHGDIPLAVRAVKDGALDFIEKPASEAHLLEAIEAARRLTAERPDAGPDRAEAALRLARLTAREREVLEHVVVGLTNKSIAEKFGISQRTVEIHRSRIREKLEARGLADLIRIMR